MDGDGFISIPSPRLLAFIKVKSRLLSRHLLSVMGIKFSYSHIFNVFYSAKGTAREAIATLCDLLIAGGEWKGRLVLLCYSVPTQALESASG